MRKPPIDDLVELRTRAAAIVLLTSRDDLKVMDDPREAGLDLIVSLVKEGQTTFRRFGVVMYGYIKNFSSSEEAGESMKSILRKRAKIEPGLMPICVFSFAMTGRSGYYAWKFEPVIGADGPRLRQIEELKCQELDEAALADIVKKVDDYYDSLMNVVIES